jgi:hypothetical protein
MLVANSAMQVVLWAVESSWGFTAAWTGFVEPVVQALVGVVLLGFGSRVVAIGLAFGLVAFATPVLRSVLLLHEYHPAVRSGPLMVALVLSGPAGFGVLRALPILLLLCGTQSPRRRQVAAVAFVLWMLVFVSLRGLMLYSFQFTSSR